MDSPVNYQSRDANRIDNDVQYALTTLANFRSTIARSKLDVDGLRFLELGPGTDFGAQLLLASMGAQVTLADRYLARWDHNYHPQFYRRLLDAWEGPNAQVRAAVERGGYEGTSLTLIEEAAEDLASVPDEAMDFVYSNAVLEHIVDIRRVAREMARVSRFGGWSSHQIDWRNHRDFDRPLDHLAMRDGIFRIAAEDSHWEIGNRFRSIEFWTHFESVGLMVFEREETNVAPPEYLEHFLPVLRASASSYRDWPEVDLKRTSGRLLMRREAGARAEILKTRAADVLALIEALKRTSYTAGQVEAGKQKPAGEFEQEFRVDPSSLTQDGFLWEACIPGLPEGDTPSNNYAARSEVFEDGIPLGPGNALQDHIRTRGAGRFSHWGNNLLFSTSDNSSPRENGRRYTIRVPRE